MGQFVGRAAIGVDIGGTHVRAARVGGDGIVLASARARSSADPQAVRDTTIALIGQVMAPEVEGIGIGVPGRVDAAANHVLSGGYVDLSTLPFAEQISAATGHRVVLDNDCSMALRGEAAYGAGRGCANVVMLTIGTGIGGAILDHGQVLHGRGTAGQLGHIVVDPAGMPCVCGRRGCVETLSSGTAFAAHLRSAGLPPETTADILLARRDQGDATADAVLKAWAGPLQAAIDSLIATLDPERVILGGGLGGQAATALAGISTAPCWYQSPVLAAALGDDAGVIGAARYALECFAGQRGKRAVLVNGVPASGKSSVARDLSAATGWPLLTLDTIKDPFLQAIDGVDRTFNRTLGKASYQAIWSLVRDAPDGATFIVDAWFGFQPAALLEEHLRMAGVTATAEIWCHAPPDLIAERYATRLEHRLPGHPGASYVPELRTLAANAAPVERGPMLQVDTAEPVAIAPVADWLKALSVD